MSEYVECGTCGIDLALEEVAGHAVLIHAGSSGHWRCGVCSHTEEKLPDLVAHTFRNAHDVGAISYVPQPGLFLYLRQLQEGSANTEIEKASVGEKETKDGRARGTTKFPRLWGKRLRSPSPEDGEDKSAKPEGARKIGCTNCRRVFTFNSPRDAVRHCMQCFGFRPYCCSVCGHQSPDEHRLRNCHMKVEHSAVAGAVVEVCGPRAQLETAIRAHLEQAYPFQATIAMSWPGLDPRNKLEEILGVEARVLKAPVEAPTATLEKPAEMEEDFESFCEEDMTSEERMELRRERERRACAYVKKPRPVVEVLPSEARKEACLVCERRNHIRAPRDGRPTATAVMRHATICGGFRPFLCTLCPYSNPVRYEVKCHIKKIHSADPDPNMGIAPDLEEMEAGIRAHALRCFPQYAPTVAAWRGIRLYEGEGPDPNAPNLHTSIPHSSSSSLHSSLPPTSSNYQSYT